MATYDDKDESGFYIGKLKTGSRAVAITPDQQNKLFILICEILDNEHDLDRASEQVSPLYLYCSKLMSNTSEFWKEFEDFVYVYDARSKKMNKHSILVKMRAILSKLYKGYYTEEVITTQNKTLDGCRTFVHNDYKRVGCLITETRRGDDKEPENNQTNMVDIKRSELTDTFDNSCTWTNTDLYIPNNELIGKILNDIKRVYSNVFPKAASVFVYKNELTEANVMDIMGLIQRHSSSIMLFDDTELGRIVVELSAFIRQINNIDSLEEGPFLLHIFKNINKDKTKDKEAGDFTFSLQTGQLTLNQVTNQIGWGTKRGSCFNMETLDIDTDTMIFSNLMTPFMKNCHASYGKLCGDGVTIYATSQCARNNLVTDHDKIPALLSIDEFCCLRAIVSLGVATKARSAGGEVSPVAAFRQSPSSVLSGTGLGRLIQSRVVGVYMKGNITLTPIELAAQNEKDQQLANERVEKIRVAALHDACNALFETLARTNGVISELSLDVFIFLVNHTKIFNQNVARQTEFIIPGDIFNINADRIKTLFDGNTTNISKFNDFCTEYNNRLISLSDTNIAQKLCPRASRTMANENANIVEMFFANLGSFESFLETCGVNYYNSRTHIIYIMITRLFNNMDFTKNIPGFVRGLFSVVDGLNLDSSDINVYIGNYTSLLEIYNGLNDRPDLTQLEMELKIKLRKNIVILKYLIRALATCQQIRVYPSVPLPDASPSPTNEADMNISCTDVFKWVQHDGTIIRYDQVDHSYDVVMKSSASSVLTPAKSPGATPNGKSEPTEEDSLDNFLQSGDDEECNIDVAPTGAASDVAEMREYQETYTPSVLSAFGLGGSRNNPTRKRKPSKMPRRTIRRRASKRGKKRTIRRRRGPRLTKKRRK